MPQRQISSYTAWVLGIWFVQLAIRIPMAVYASRYNTLVGDQHGYDVLGIHFFEYLVHGNCERLPLYPLFLSGLSIFKFIFSLSKKNYVLIVLIVQHGMMMFSIHLMSKLIARFTDHARLGYLISLVVFSLYFPILLSPNGLLTESLYIFLLTVPTYLLATELSDNSTKTFKKILLRYSTAGFLFGCSALVRPNILPFPFLIAPALILASPGAYRYVAAFLVVFSLTIAPWMIRNHVIYGQFAYTSVSGKNLYSANKFEDPLTATGFAFAKQHGRPSLNLDAKKLGRMQNNLKGFLKRDDVYRNTVYLDAAIQHIKWHSNIEFAAFYKSKFDRFLQQLFQGATVEYHYAKVSFPVPPAYVHNLYHFILMGLAILYFIGKTRKITPPEIVILMHVVYAVALFQLAPVCPRMLLPSVFFFLYFAVKRVVALPLLTHIKFLEE